MTYVFQTFFRYLMTILILAVWFGLVVMPVVCALIGPKSRREGYCRAKEDEEAVTDAPISVSGGAPTAAFHLALELVSLFIGLLHSARPRREARSTYRVADGGRHRVVRRVHTHSRTPNGDVRVDYASRRPDRATHRVTQATQPMLGRSSVREAAPTASLFRRLSLATNATTSGANATATARRRRDIHLSDTADRRPARPRGAPQQHARM